MRILSKSVAATATVAFLLVSCSSGVEVSSDQPTATTSGSNGGAVLGGASIASSARGEMDVVRFAGVDPNGDLDDLELVAVADDDNAVELFVFADEVGLFALLPLHPATPGQGGPVTLEMTLGDEQASFDIELDALPAAPGAFDGFVETMRTELERRATQLGSSLDELSTAPMTGLDDDLATIKLVAGFVDDGTDHDLESTLDRLGLTPEQVALADAIVAKTNPIDLLSVDGSSSGEVEGIMSARVRSGRAASALAEESTAGCRVKTIPIDTMEQLASALQTGLDARNAVADGFLGDETDQFISNVTAGGGILIGAGVVTGVLAPEAVVAGGALGAANAVYATARLLQMTDAANYPSKFDTLDVAVDKPTMNEDFIEDGRITKADLTASSPGFNAADAFAGIGAAAADAILATGVGKAAGEAGRVADGMIASTGFLRETTLGEAIKTGKEFFEFCGQSWTLPVPLDKKYLEIFPVGPIEVDVEAATYRPTKVGDAKIRLETTSFFPGAYAIADANVTTERLEVFGSPLEIEVERAGATIAITGTIQSADTLKLAWETERGEWVDGLGDETDFRETTRQLETPQDDGAYPFDVRMTSRSTTGLREAATDERRATVTVKLKGLTVEPDPGTVRPGGLLQFTAKGDDGAPREATWRATGGVIDKNSGLYTAGTVPGTYSVTATAKDDRNVSDSATVIISGDCPVGSWSLRSAEFFDQLAASDAGDISYLSGDYLLSMFADGTWAAVRDAWSFEIRTEQGLLVGVISGSETGTWASTDDLLVFAEAESTSKVELFIDGVAIQGGSGSFSEPGSFAGELPFTCDASVMSFLSEAAFAKFDRQGS